MRKTVYKLELESSIVAAVPTHCIEARASTVSVLKYSTVYIRLKSPSSQAMKEIDRSRLIK